MVRQVLVGVCLSAHTDLHPGKVLTAQLGDDGLDAVVTACAAFGADAEPSGGQGNIIEQDDDPLGRNAEIGAQLKHAAAGEIHICLGLQEHDLGAVVQRLTVQALEFALVDFAAQLVSQQIHGAEASVVAGVGIVLAGIAQAHDEPGIIGFLEHDWCYSSESPYLTYYTQYSIMSGRKAIAICHTFEVC